MLRLILFITIVTGLLRFFTSNQPMSITGGCEALTRVWIGILIVLVWQKDHKDCMVRPTAILALVVMIIIELMMLAVDIAFG